MLKIIFYRLEGSYLLEIYPIDAVNSNIYREINARIAWF